MTVAENHNARVAEVVRVIEVLSRGGVCPTVREFQEARYRGLVDWREGANRTLRVTRKLAKSGKEI